MRIDFVFGKREDEFTNIQIQSSEDYFVFPDNISLPQIKSMCSLNYTTL